MYQGGLAHKIADVSPLIGGPIAYGDIRGALPKLMKPLVGTYGNDRVAFLPPPADGGLATMAAFEVLARNPNDLAGASARALSAAARFRAGGISADAILGDKNLPAAGLPALPASTSLVAMDRDGNVVACSLTMDNLFGAGRILPGTGILAAASPAAVPAPLLSASVAWNEHIHSFRAAVAGSGQQAAPAAVASTMIDTLRSGRPMGERLAPEPGRANMAACAEYLPGNNRLCAWANDPRANGLALGAN
jgi:gamma-glutamyltranspeptidase/glutathione hydrolase